jgi:phenylpropionate dioxygenase-like ring-hydroxylating dioxygenase large terminal subunit
VSFVRNTWYMGAWSSEVSDKPVARKMLSEPVVMFRTSSGALGALRDVCPHRAVPLSLGTVEGEHLRCPYHALEFDTAGICRLNPHVKSAPERITNGSYPVVERHGMIWVWLGDAAAADPETIVDYSIFNDASRFTTCTGYLHVLADYRLVIDNLMDLAHAEYIHPNTVGSLGAAKVQQAKVVQGDGSITVHSLWPNLPPNAVSKPVWTKSERVDQYQDMTWRPASNLLLDLGYMAPGEGRSDGNHTPSAHILTPETDRSTHYFWAFARDFAMSSAEVTAGIAETVQSAFLTEDKPMIEAAQLNLDGAGATLRNFTVGDAGSAAVRREIERLLALEKNKSAVA